MDRALGPTLIALLLATWMMSSYTRRTMQSMKHMWRQCCRNLRSLDSTAKAQSANSQYHASISLDSLLAKAALKWRWERSNPSKNGPLLRVLGKYKFFSDLLISIDGSTNGSKWLCHCRNSMSIWWFWSPKAHHHGSRIYFHISLWEMQRQN